MKKTKISIGLSEREIDKALRCLENYKRNFLHKVESFKETIANEIAQLAQNGFNGAIVDDLLQNSGQPREASVDVSVSQKGGVMLVIASGEDAVWVEFGAGVYHNGSVGQSPHPSSSELGFTIGSFGKGNGQRKTWGYYEDGELMLTHGTPATMPMYNALKIVCDEIENVAKEVFG